MGLENYWWLVFASIASAYIAMIGYTRDKRYVYYSFTGALTGLYLDLVSVSQGYYSYVPYFPTFFGVPLSVTISEGFSIALTIFIYKNFLQAPLRRIFRTVT